MYYSTRMKERASRKTPFSRYWDKKFAEDREREERARKQKENPFQYQYHFIGR